MTMNSNHLTAVVSAAGSSGKSSTVSSLAVLKGTPDKPVLVIDGDPQADVTHSLGVRDPDLTTGDVLVGRAELKEAIVETDYPGVWLLPARPDMTDALVEWSRRRGAELRVQRLRDDIPDGWHAIFDCAGKITDDVTFAAAVGADTVITTTYPRGKEVKGIAQVEDLIAEVNETYAWHARLAGIVVCAVPPASEEPENQRYLDALTETYPDLVAPPVRRSPLVGQAYSVAQPVPIYSPSAHVTRDYRNVLAFLQEQGVTA